jgi:hypothetical protein
VRVSLVAADPNEVPAIELDLDPAIALAQDAGGLLPLIGHGGSSFDYDERHTLL